jgi:signal transduction histidine kinase/ActR/RegA family two-component response regulator
MLVGGTVFAIVASEMCSALISLMMTGEVSGVVWLAAFVAPAVVASAELVVLIAVIRHLRRKNQRLSEAEAALTRDIRERQDYEDGLRQAKQAAEEANAAKDRFLAMMSHEIRTPITSVLGMADLLYRTPLIEEQASYLGSLRSSARTLLTILNDILDFSKIEADKVVIEATCFHLRGAVREIVDLAQGTASAKGLCLEPILGEQAPAAVIGDPTRLKQVLLNLISNAIKFTESGTIRIRMSVKQELDEGVLVLFEVEDSGIGIAPEQRDILFTAFSQADQSTTRRFGGTGLGLSISKKLVELMGGEIGVQSEPGLGATFWFTLPFALGAGAVPPDLLPATPPPLPLPWRPLRILLAEDNRINQMLVRSMLQKFGHTVQVVENGRQAVDAVVAGDVDIVLMDMQMPEMDGEQATQAIRALPPPKNRLPVLAFTADVMAENRERYLRAGVNDLVAKPIDWETLSDALEAQTRIPVRAPVPAGTGST